MRRGAEPVGLALTLLAVTAGGCASPGERAAAPVVAGIAAAAPPPVDRQLMVVLDSTHESRWQTLAGDLGRFFRLDLLYSWPMLSLDEQCLVFAVPADRRRDEMLEMLAADKRIAAVQPVRSYRTLGADWNDAYAHLQPSLDALGLAAAHGAATGRGVRLALIDTGVDVMHPDLVGRIALARSFVPRGEESFARDVHGTAVAGVLGAVAGNGIGVVGIAPGSEIEALKACWPDPPASRQAVCDSYTLARALDFAISRRAQVINLSLGGPFDGLLARMLERAEALGLLIVAAADPDPELAFPASLPSVLGVAALGIEQPPAGAALLGAPAADLLTTGPQGAYDFFSGSSFAAAEVAGVAALLLEARPDLAPAAVRALLVEGARPSDSGPPQLSACGALGRALGRDLCAAGPGN